MLNELNSIEEFQSILTKDSEMENNFKSLVNKNKCRINRVIHLNCLTDKLRYHNQQRIVDRVRKYIHAV